jgi:ribosome-associated protein
LHQRERMTKTTEANDATKSGLGPLETAQRARAAAEDKKGLDVVILDVRGTSPVTDYYVIASGTSAPQLKAMMNEVQHELKAAGVTCYRRSGVPDDGWVVLDFYDVVMHILLTDLREYYALEELWADAPRL